MHSRIIWNENAFAGHCIINESFFSTETGAEKIRFSVHRAKMQIDAAKRLRKNPRDCEKLLDGVKVLLDSIEKDLAKRPAY
ncbi:hypothetical protein HZA41_00370 [Candidatus Peregrinibacteria bacterium]|nr:hypothetical protein [Candidatus Peregrinibacteria bacterium]